MVWYGIVWYVMVWSTYRGAYYRWVLSTDGCRLGHVNFEYHLLCKSEAVHELLQQCTYCRRAQITVGRNIKSQNLLDERI